MNFEFMPELESRYGYFVVVGTMLTICTGLFIRFKRLGWL
jgi:magnesium transporter